MLQVLKLEVYTSVLNAYTYLFTESQALVRKSIQLVLTDGGFNIPSVPAQTAQKTAEKLLEWVSDSDNSSLFASFASDLIKQLESCFKSSYQSFQRRREKMWEQLLKLRSSPRFRAMWSSFLLESIGVPACPIFFQYVVDDIFNSLIKHHFKCDEPEEEEVDDHIQLNYEEQNALRYTAGYVVNALIKKLKHSTHPLKEEMMCCLLEVDDRTEGDTPHGTEDWTRKVDRGDLKRIGDMMYGAFEAIELETRRFFRRDPSRLQNFKTQLQEKILSSDDVKFFWAIVSAGWEEDESEALLELLVEQYVTVRGFSFASGWMEKYKQANKKSSQKSKGVRKQLLSKGVRKQHDWLLLCGS